MLGVQDRGWRTWREFALLSALLLDLTWITPWLHAVLASPGKASIGAAIGVLVLLALATYAIVRGSAVFDLSPSLRRWALVLPLIVGAPFGLAAILFPSEALGYAAILRRFTAAMSSSVSIIPDEFLAALGLFYVWMRAVRSAASDGLPSEIRARFKFGFLALIAYVFAFIWRGDGGGLGVFLYAYFFFGWLAMACARLGRAEAHAAAEPFFFRRGWFLAVVGGLLASSLFLVLLGWGIETQFALIQRAAMGLWLLFWGLVILLLSPFAVVISLVFEWLLARLNLSDSALLETLREIFNNAEDVANAVFEQAAETGQTPFWQRLSEWLNSLPFAELLTRMRTGFFWGVLLLLVLIGLYQAGKRIGFWRALRTRRLDEQASVQNEDWWRTMSSAWRSRFGDLRRNLANLFDPQQGRRLLAAARIRRVYTYLMDLSEEMGKPRPRAQTPLEFMPTLLKLFPLHPAEVEAISGAYMRVRYGELAETPTDVVEVDRAWLQLKMEGERVKKLRRKAAAEAKTAQRRKQKAKPKDRN
jgi:hypothetical protein